MAMQTRLYNVLYRLAPLLPTTACTTACTWAEMTMTVETILKVKKRATTSQPEDL
jgi:hypothetical protein